MAPERLHAKEVGRLSGFFRKHYLAGEFLYADLLGILVGRVLAYKLVQNHDDKYS